MASKSKQALGKGLAALIPGGVGGMEPPAGLPGNPYGGDENRVHSVAIDQISPSPFQPRNQFTQEQLEELMVSIKEHGIIQPLIVRQHNGKMELIAGERRWRASRELGLKEVPVIIRTASDKDVLEWALVENLQREDLNPIEEAAGYVRLAKEFKLKQDDIAARVGKSRVSIANAIRLLDLHQDIQDMVSQGKLSVGHAKAILSVKDKDLQCQLAKEVVKKSLTVRQTEKTAKDILSSPSSKPEKAPATQKSSQIEELEQQLAKAFLTKVLINQIPSANKGKLEIHYSNQEELKRVLELLGVDPTLTREIN